MDALALALAGFAALLFIVDFVDRRTPPTPRWPNLIPLGLFFLTVALICQFVHATTTTVTIH